VPGFGGNVMAAVTCPNQRPQIATVRPGVFKKDERKSETRRSKVVKMNIDIEEEDLQAKTVEIVEERPTDKSVEDAEIVVAGGWGLYSSGGFQQVRELAEVVGASVGGTRPAVDEGWITEEQMIGQSGKTIRPKLYIGVGISGAMQHIVGILDSKVVVAINKDPEAPIFEASDLGIVGEAQKILPLLVEEFRRLKR